MIERQLARLRAHPVRYPLACLGQHERAPEEARRLVLEAAGRILAELGDDGITIGAEEDAEAAIYVVAYLVPAPGLRAPGLVVAAAVLLRALEEIRGEEGITSEAATALRGVVRGNCSHPSSAIVGGVRVCEACGISGVSR